MDFTSSSWFPLSNKNVFINDIRNHIKYLCIPTVMCWLVTMIISMQEQQDGSQVKVLKIIQDGMD